VHRELESEVSDTCKGCGRKIVWGYNPETKKNVPLDPSAPVYRIIDRTIQGRVLRRVGAEEQVMVSHFKTCSKADEFSSSKRRTADAE
jgi:hypothetical protein